jgi:hypothetical protein
MEAAQVGKAPPVVLAATAASAVEYIPLDMLVEHAVDKPGTSGEEGSGRQEEL